jgi:hypothetical protein
VVWCDRQPPDRANRTERIIDRSGNCGACRGNAGFATSLTPSGLSCVGASSKRATSILGISAMVGIR